MKIDVKTRDTARENTKYVELGEIHLIITDGY